MGGMKKHYYVATVEADGTRYYLDTHGNFTKNLYRNKNGGTLAFFDAETALLEAELFDALVLTEGEVGLVPI